MDSQEPEDSPEIPSSAMKQTGQSGGVNVFGGENTFEGDVVGRDKYDSSTGVPVEELNRLFLPLLQSLGSLPAEKQPDLQGKVQELKAEVAKGRRAEDSRIATLVDGILDLVPSAVSTITGIFASPILKGIAGPITKFVLAKIRG
jgi:hypothetical protein